MELELGNSKAQIATPGPCCNHETINAVGSIPESKDTVNTVADSERPLMPLGAPEGNSEKTCDVTSDDVFEAVTKYLEAGVSVLPCRPGGKDPLINGAYKGATRDIDRARAWWRLWPQARIGIPTGTENGFFVLDIDIEKGDAPSGAKSLATLENRFGGLPETYTVRTPSGGEHRYFKMPQGPLRSSVNRIGSRLDIRGDGTYAIAAGSRGYTVQKGRFKEFAEAPEWLIRLCRDELSLEKHAPKRNVHLDGVNRGDGIGQLRALASEVKNAPNGQRHTTILTKANAAGYLVRDGLVTWAQAVSSLRRAVSCHQYTQEEREAEYKTVEDGVSFVLNDKDAKSKQVGTGQVQPELIEMLKQHYGDGNIISNGGCFFVWRNDGVWRPVPEAELKHRMCKMLGRKASNSVIKGACEMALYDLYTPAFMDRKNEHIINCRNGELSWVDNHWQFNPNHMRERYALSQIPVHYDPDAKCPVFDKYLETSFGSQSSGRQTSQLLLEMTGYTLLPTCHLQKFGFMYGPPGCGKSVFLELLGELVGKESHTAIFLSELNRDSNRADLQGKLLHTIGDLDPDKKIMSGMLKSLSSGDIISARLLFDKPFIFKPTATIWMASNSFPSVGDFKAIERRVALIEFANSIPAERQDKHLIAKLRDELSGVMNRALEAFADVLRRNGTFTEPENTKQLFEFWGESADDLAAFINECCVLGDDLVIASGDLYAAYHAWAKRGSVRFPVPSNKLVSKLRAICQIKLNRTGGTRKVRGIALK